MTDRVGRSSDSVGRTSDSVRHSMWRTGEAVRRPRLAGLGASPSVAARQLPLGGSDWIGLFGGRLQAGRLWLLDRRAPFGGGSPEWELPQAEAVRRPRLAGLGASPSVAARQLPLGGSDWIGLFGGRLQAGRLWLLDRRAPFGGGSPEWELPQAEAVRRPRLAGLGASPSVAARQLPLGGSDWIGLFGGRLQAGRLWLLDRRAPFGGGSPEWELPQAEAVRRPRLAGLGASPSVAARQLPLGGSDWIGLFGGRLQAGRLWLLDRRAPFGGGSPEWELPQAEAVRRPRLARLGASPSVAARQLPLGGSDWIGLFGGRLQAGRLWLLDRRAPFGGGSPEWELPQAEAVRRPRLAGLGASPSVAARQLPLGGSDWIGLFGGRLQAGRLWLLDRRAPFGGGSPEWELPQAEGEAVRRPRLARLGASPSVAARQLPLGGSDWIGLFGGRLQAGRLWLLDRRAPFGGGSPEWELPQAEAVRRPRLARLGASPSVAARQLPLGGSDWIGLFGGRLQAGRLWLLDRRAPFGGGCLDR